MPAFRVNMTTDSLTTEMETRDVSQANATENASPC
jgi:hypothetical protein